MAMHDWNKDGKKDGMDNFIEYQVFNNTRKNSTDTSHEHISRNKVSKNSMSGLSLILCIFSGLFWQVLLFTMLEVDIEDVSSFLIVVLWIVFSTITVGIVEVIRL